jgi:predicted transcriptional regulator YdeE
MDNLKIIGIATETSNQDGRSTQDIGQLWERFYAENIKRRILEKAGDEVYAIYTDYESEYTGKYTIIIGLKVKSLDHIPMGLVGREFEPLTFRKFTAKGKMPGAVVDAWKEIWKNDKDPNRRYQYDFEVYGAASQNGENSVVDIFVGKIQRIVKGGFYAGKTRTEISSKERYG